MKFTKENTQDPYEDYFSRITENLNQECDQLIRQNQGHRVGKTIRKCIEEFRPRQTRLFNGDPKLNKNDLLEDFVTGYRWEQDSYLDMPVLRYAEEYYTKLQEDYSKLISKGSNESTGIYRLELLDEKNFAELLLVWAEENAIEEWIRKALVKLGQEIGEIGRQVDAVLGAEDYNVGDSKERTPKTLKVVINPEVRKGLHEQIKEWFNETDHESLLLLLNGEELEGQLVFEGYSSQWGDMLGKLYKDNDIRRDREVLIAWTCWYFQYQDRDGKVRDFSEENLRKQIKADPDKIKRIPKYRRIYEPLINETT